MYKGINKYAVLFVAILVVMLQLIFTLAQRASFSLVYAQTTGTTTPVTINLYADNIAVSNGMILNGTESFRANINPPMVFLTSGPSAPLSGVNFYFDTTSSVPTAGINNGPDGSGGTNYVIDSAILNSLIDGNYIFYAKATYLSGSDEAIAESQHYNMTISRVPAAPTGLIVDGTPTTSSIPLSWTDNSTNEDKFNLERKLTTATDWSGASSFLINGSNITTYTDNTVAASTSYDYRVQACRSGYGCSGYAYKIGVSSASAVSVPAAPTNLSLASTSTPGYVSLQWTDNSNNEDRFTVQRKLASVASWNDFVPDSTNSFLVNYANATSYVDTTVTVGTTYDYRVAACTIAAGCSGYANLNGVTPVSGGGGGGGGSCTSLSLSLNDGKTTYTIGDYVNYTWTCFPGIASNVSVGLQKPDGSFTIYNYGSGSSTQTMGFSTSNLIAGSYVLKACFDSSCTTANASQSFAVVPGSTSSTDTTSPSIPSGLVATKDNYNEVNLSWTASTDNVGVTGYEVWRSLSGTWSQIGQTSVLTYIDTTVSASTPYYYKVIAYDAAGNKSSPSAHLFLNTPAASSSSTTTTTATMPVAPSNLRINATTTATSISLAWNDNSTNEDKFNLERKLTTATDWTGAWSIQIPAANTISYNDTSVIAGVNYDYRVQACLSGTGCSDYAYKIGVSSMITTTPYLSASIDSATSTSYSSPSFISGSKLASVTSNTSFPSGSLIFHLYKYSSAGVVDTTMNYYTSLVGNISLVSSSEGKNWTGTINANNLSNGNYKFFAKGSNNGIDHMSNPVYFAVSGSTVSIVSPTPIPNSIFPNITVGVNSTVSGSTISGTKTIWANSSAPLTGLTFKFYNTATNTLNPFIITAYPSTSTAPDAFGNYNYWLGSLDTAKLPNGNYKLIAKGVYNNNPYENSAFFYFNVNNLASSIASPPPVPMMSPLPSSSIYPNPTLNPINSPYPIVSPSTMYFPSECQEKGYTTPESCQKYMQFPFECRTQNLLDPIKCQNYMFQFAMPEICRQQGVTTQEECSKIILVNSFPQQCKDAKITDEAGCISFMNANSFLTAECKAANISDPAACGTYMTEKFMPQECVDGGAKTKEDCDYIMRTKYGNLIAQTTIGVNMAVPLQGMGSMPSECQEQNITDPAACEKIMIAKYMPEDCKAANITTKEGCEKYLFEKNAPKECIDAKITNPKDCENFIFKNNAPKDCIDAGIMSPEGCKKFMFEKYGDQDNIPLDNFPVECQKAGAKSLDDCEKIMTQSYLPEDCKKNSIVDSGQCDAYLKQKYMPEECRQAGVKTQKECDNHMFKKYAPDDCKKAGIEDEKECKDYMFNLYAPKAICQGLDDWQCKNIIKEDHLGSIVAKQAEYAKVKIEIASLAGGEAVKTEDLREKMGDSGKIIPIVENDASLKIIKTEENLVLNENNDLVQTASAALMVDSDNDGLTDDMEQRIGTDPKKSDSDGDGFKDSDEVKAGYNPLGEGKLAEGKLAPIDEAILNNETLRHPKIEGTESDKYSFDNVSNVEAGKGDTDSAKYLFKGKAEADSVVTLYVYSDLPIVMTVKTDKYGNWHYEFDKSLKDGEHEAYVVLNDNTGKVVTRSSVMSFFVNEAKAIGIKDFISPANASEAPVKESEKIMNNYMFITVGIIVVGLILFIGFMLYLKKRNQIPKE